MDTTSSFDASRTYASSEDVQNASTDRQLSPALSSASPSAAETSASDGGFLSPQDQREDALSSRPESAASSKIKKKFSELDIRGAIGDLDIRKGGKRTGVEEFYIQLDEPLRMFWTPGDIVRGTP
jgi:hypothetical protein